MFQVHDDGSWLIAVVDGLGGHPRGDEAASAAIEALPERIAGKCGMHVVCRAVHQPVFDSAPEQAQDRLGIIDRCPATTLCATASTPAGGLIVGVAGHASRAHSASRRFVERLSAAPASSQRRRLGIPHALPRCSLRLARIPRQPPSAHGGTDSGPDSAIRTVGERVRSDGVWEALMRGLNTNKLASASVLGEAVAGRLEPADDTADVIAARIMRVA